MTRRRASVLAAAVLLGAMISTSSVEAQGPKLPEAAPVERVGENELRVGTIHVDLKNRIIAVPGTVNPATALEFIANTKGGYKAYESAVTLDTNAVSFNLALILVGLDKNRSVPSRRHFDPSPPEGDPVEVWIEWTDEGQVRKIRGEDLVFNTRTKTALPRTHWVYTGSVFLRDGRYLAEAQGVLIGFVHTPAAIIDNPSPDGVGAYGSFQINPSLGLKAGTPVKVTVRALAQ